MNIKYKKKEIKKFINKYFLVQEKVNYDLDRNKFISQIRFEKKWIFI